ncbi:MAG: STT3 domain-containing protein, partial [archaeon]|nr:STT3 domain-containing protein [archaeon]
KPYQKIAFAIILMLVLISAMPGFLSKGTYLSLQDREALSWMKENTPTNAVIFSQWDLGHPVTYLAQRITFMDGYFEFAPDVKQRNDEMNILISTSNCERIQSLVQKNNLDYFFIPTKAINSNTYKYGALEADCEFESMVYASNSTKIIKWN